jgi:Cu+-exporting ATPase
MEIFVFVVITLAGVTFIVAFSRNRTASFLASLTVACSRAMAVLAAACPCGFGLATPSAALAGIDAAYAQGCLAIGGIRTMETLNRVTHVIMDKTGTLTTGRLSVVDHEISRDLGLEKGICYRLLLAAEAEDAQIHPVARAVFKWALAKVQQTESSQEPFVMPETRELHQHLGNGLSCKVKVSPHLWTTVHIGTNQFLYENNIAIPSALGSDEQMPNVLFAFNHVYSGYLQIHDTLRHEVPSIIKTLSASNLNITLLTGDSAPEAERVSHLLNIPVLASRASPSDKLLCVQDLQRQGHCVAMVGDGINDVLAQAAADVGVSISLTQGCLAGSGGVIITSGSLEALVHIFEISRKVVRQAKWNVKWAITYNVVALSLAIGDWVTP